MSHENGPGWMMTVLVSSSCSARGKVGKENLPKMT